MLELVMVAANPDKSPTVCLKRPYQITAFHRVYYTHHYRIATTCAGESNAVVCAASGMTILILGFVDFGLSLRQYGEWLLRVDSGLIYMLAYP